VSDDSRSLGAFERLTVNQVRSCAREAEARFQGNPQVVPARSAAAWARLVTVMRETGCETVGDLGAAAVLEWKRELGFSAERPTEDLDWPRARDSIRDRPSSDAAR
jgi:hypothetical protein